MVMSSNRQPLLPSLVQFGLFATSFIPLFILIILRQFTDNSSKLRWGGLSRESVFLFFRLFGVSFGLAVISIIGLFILYRTMRNLESHQLGGFPVYIRDVRNRNAESISYIGTYIIPFL